MKRTKTMTYRPTDEARELFLFATNTEELYRKRIVPVIASLARKMQAGKYDKEKAIDLWYYTATDASDTYNRYYGYRFSVGDRFTTATDLEEYFRDEVEDKAQDLQREV